MLTGVVPHAIDDAKRGIVEKNVQDCRRLFRTVIS